MNTYNKTNFIRFLCVIMSILLFLCSCNSQKKNNKTPKNGDTTVNDNSANADEFDNSEEEDSDDLDDSEENEDFEISDDSDDSEDIYDSDDDVFSDSDTDNTSENKVSDSKSSSGKNSAGKVSTDKNVTDNKSANSGSTGKKPSGSAKTSSGDNSKTSSKPSNSGSNPGSNSDSGQPDTKPKETVIKPTKPDEGSLQCGKNELNGSAAQIKSLKMLTSNPTSFKMVEMEMDVPELPDDVNVYDEKDVDITAKFVSSTAKTITTDAFYYKEYDFLSSGQLKGDSGKDAKFRIRMSPQEEGTWDFEVTYSLKGKKLDSVSGYFNVKKNKNGSSLIKVEPVRKQNFVTASGTPYIAIGENIAWGEPSSASTMASKYVREQMRNCAQYGGNYARIWLNCWGGLAIESKTEGVLKFRQSSSAQWDKIFAEAEKLGTKITFSIYNHGQFQSSGADAYFTHTPWSTIISTPIEFFTNEDAIYVSRQELRYLVSRYGYSESILCWELFNEVDLVTNAKANTDLIRKWYIDTCDYLREIDPYRHLVSSSTAEYTSPLSILSCFDFINYHRYNYGALSNLSDLIKETWVSYRRPVLISECGSMGDEITLMGGYIPEDLSNFHRQNWVGLMGGGAGTAMTWWWDAVKDRDAFWDFQILSEMSAHVPWSNNQMYMYRTESANLSNNQIEALGYRGTDFAYLWFYDKMFTHLHRVTTDFENVTAEVKLQDGTYHVRWINTWTGISVKKEVIKTDDGILKFTMPKWSKDIAVAITVD